jgi:2Fe-2S ferredoxin|tara:strand:- start:46 stop:453 length:408 start_codon:yes stop_codon:yes gene_type:complete
MSGLNPYIEQVEIQLPRQPFQVTFEPQRKTVNILPGEMLEESDGLPGSLLQLALNNDIDLDHSCGGVCACSTCHVIVRSGFESCNVATEDEEDMLDLAPGLQPQSRLACQCVPDGTSNIVIEIPEWNRNLVSESH